MTDRLIPLFDKFSNEVAIVGRLLMFYGELEWRLASCLGAVLDGKDDDARLDLAARIMFRAQGEEMRIQIADAIMREKFINAKLEPPYSEFIGDLGYCKLIRNQYAHCQWWDHSGVLSFLTFEKGAKKHGIVVVDGFPIRLAALRKQEEFFHFVSAGLLYLEAEYQHWAGRPSIRRTPRPKKMDRPPPHSATA